MSETFNIYCDESCHLENDGQKAMVLGAVWCPEAKRLEIAQRLREIKARHKLPADFEIKWTKVGSTKLQFYLDCIDYFFDDDDLHFRALIVADKARLNHQQYRQSHDDWYYKMYFSMLKTIFEPNAGYHVYIDIKDTKLHEVLANNAYDFSRRVIRRVQRIHSHEAEQLQLADLLIGALSYLHRGLAGSEAKQRLIERIRERSRYNLKQNTLLRESKFNLFLWNGSNGV